MLTHMGRIEGGTVDQTTLEKKEAHINRSMVTCKGSARRGNYLETFTDPVPADPRQ